MKKFVLALMLVGLGTLGLVRAQESTSSTPPHCVRCVVDSGCGRQQYCWNSVCRDLPPELLESQADRDSMDELGGDDDPLTGIDTGACTNDTHCMGDGSRCIMNRCVANRDPATCTQDTQCGYKEICLRRHCTLVECNTDVECADWRQECHRRHCRLRR